jgi:hypothetical protein
MPNYLLVSNNHLEINRIRNNNADFKLKLVQNYMNLKTTSHISSPRSGESTSSIATEKNVTKNSGKI